MRTISATGAPVRPTLEMVAAAAGVSKATASKVLNKRPDVAPATRQRVEAAFADLGYAPWAEPRAVTRLPLVNVVFDTLVNIYSSQVLNGILAAGRELGVEVIVDVIDGADGPDAPLSLEWIRAVGRSGRLGVVVVTTTLDRDQVRAFRDSGIELAVIDPPGMPDDEDITSLGSTNYAGGVQATEHLIELGHRRIAYAGGPRDSSAARERFNGYRSALEGAGLAVDPELVRHGRFAYESGVAMTSELLGLPEPPTAIFAGCDASALGVLEGARRMHVRVPDDLSVVGFDDTSAALWSAPPLTTVRQPIIELGRAALKALLAHSRGEKPDSQHIQMATRLVRRASTAPPLVSRSPREAGSKRADAHTVAPASRTSPVPS